ncbi:MAG: PKD domain-containing protein, partial [Bacteroidia bacterium]|nr:PKD domain-containing protein [Bacteroidia bacterium]
LTNVTVSYSLDNGTPVSINWNGNIIQYATTDITFSAITLTQGTHEFNAYTANPNGVADEYPDNDTLIKTFTVNNLITIANFTADDSMFCSFPATVNFINSSTNADTYLWDFGDGNTSSNQAPSHIYTSENDFDVTLIAYNGICGSDTIIKQSYISINTANACEYEMTTTGSQTETACLGILYDSGGESGQYTNNENATFTICPLGASYITVEFMSFDVEPGSPGCNYDYVEVHDGPSIASPSLGKFCNNNIPSAPISSSGGSITIHFYSDVEVVLDGFQMNWSCTMSTTPPIADFEAYPVNTCDGEVQFSDLSTEGPLSWLWDFGDGQTSAEQNPLHIYSASGTYSVTLTASNSQII